MEALLLIAASLYVMWFIFEYNFGRSRRVAQRPSRSTSSIPRPHAVPSLNHPGQISDDEDNLDMPTGHDELVPRTRPGDGEPTSLNIRDQPRATYQGDHVEFLSMVHKSATHSVVYSHLIPMHISNFTNTVQSSS